MPGPSHATNLLPNLRVLASLATTAGSPKLSYDPAAGRFSIRTAGKWTTIVRTFSSDSVTSDTHFAAPIREIFHEAWSQAPATIAVAEINNAYLGLISLRATYTEAAKLAALENVVADVDLDLRGEGSRTKALRDKYSAYVIYGFSQAMFLPRDNGGVCYSFCADWARRILAGKPTFGNSKKARPVTRVHLDADEKRRLMKKIRARIAPMQAELRDVGGLAFGTRLMFVAAGDNLQMQRFANLLIFPVGAEREIATADTGSSIFNAVRVATETHRDALVRHAEQYGRAVPGMVFIISVSAADRGSGHAVGMRLFQRGVQFFDPNVGELYFASGSETKRNEFWNEWWTQLYTTLTAGQRRHDFKYLSFEVVTPRPAQD